MFSNRLDDLIDSNNEKNVINRRQNKNATNPGLLAIERNGVTDQFEMEKRVIKKNGIIDHFQMEEEMEDTNGNTSNIIFFYQQGIRYN